MRRNLAGLKTKLGYLEAVGGDRGFGSVRSSSRSRFNPPITATVSRISSKWIRILARREDLRDLVAAAHASAFM